MRNDRARLLLLIAVLGVVGLSLWLRLPGLADKPLHSDEGVNGWFSLRLHWWNVYRYQPSDYHGPFLYYVNLVFFWIFGPSDESLRLGTALCGGLMPLLLLPLRRWLGAVGVVAGGLLLSCSPLMVFFSRTVIHEIYLVFFTLLWVVALLYFARRPRLSFALLAAGGALGAFCNKETAIITTGALGAGFALAWLLGRPGYHGATMDRDLFGGRSRAEAVHSTLVEPWPAWLAGAGLFLVGVVLFFSSFFSYTVGDKAAERLGPFPEWIVGVGGFFRAFAPWFEHGSSGRNQGKSADYFWKLMQEGEGFAIYLAVAAALAALLLRHRFGLFLVGWAVSSFAVYSLIPYKTPWCVLNIDLPVFLLCAWGAGRCVELARDFGAPPLLRLAGAILPFLLLVPLLSFAKTTLLDNQERYDDDDVPWVYVQTQRGYYDMVRDHLGVAAADPEADGLGPRVENINGKNPIRWYTITRGWDHERTKYWSWKKKKDALPSIDRLRRAGIVVAVGPVKRRVAEELEKTERDWHQEVYPLRPGWEVTAWYRQSLWDVYQERGGREGIPWPQPVSEAVHRPPKPKRYWTVTERKNSGSE